MIKLNDQRYDFSSSTRIYEGCTCEENTLRFNYCRCGARLAEMTATANEIIPQLDHDQLDAMMELNGAVKQRTANRLGYGLRKLGLITGMSRSGDNANTMTDLGKVAQNILRRA